MSTADESSPRDAVVKQPNGESRLTSLRHVASLLTLALGCAAILYTLNAVYPLRSWLFVQLIQYWGLAAYWLTACIASGAGVLSLLPRLPLTQLERAVVGGPIGMVLFALAIFLSGLAGLLNAGTFVAVPLLLIVIGFIPLRRSLARLVRHRRALRRLATKPRSAAVGLVATLGAVGLVAVYLPIITPQNIQHDARWYHLTIAQQYASQGAVAPFKEGWFLASYPHMASLEYTWAMLWPTGIVHRLELAAHMEFAVFVVTLLSVPVVLRRVVPRARIPLSWIAYFLFPGFLTYDSNLGSGADHMAAFFASGTVVLLLTFYRSPGVAAGAVLGLAIAGAAWTKYSAICIVAPTLVASWLILVPGAALVRLRLPDHSVGLAKRVLATVSVHIAFVIGFAPHWLTNLLWHGDPFYPLLYQHLKTHPWNDDAAFYFERFVQASILRPSRDLEGLVTTLKNVFSLGFRVNEYGFHGEYPTFGFLFAVALAALVFAKAPRRVWWLFGMSLVGAAAWYWTNHRDRYLQAMLPWLVVATIAVLHLAWREGVVHRAAVVLLVVIQVLAGADIYLLPNHLMAAGKHPLLSVMKLVDDGYHSKYEQRFEPYADWAFSDWRAIGRKLPPGARVLIHEDRLWLGLDAPVVVDEAGWQAGLQYGTYADARAVYWRMRALNVTHVVTGRRHPDNGDQSLAGEILFWEFLRGSTTRVATAGKLTLWELVGEPPPARFGQVALATCSNGIASGVYLLDDLRSIARTPHQYRAADAPVGSLMATAYLITEDGCATKDAPSTHGFELLGKRDKLSFWRRLGGGEIP